MEPNACVLCGRSSEAVPLLSIEYRGATLRVCSEDLPTLMHDPVRLAKSLPGGEKRNAPKPKL